MTTPEMPKKLAAILVADICGYSALVGADQEGTVGRVEAIMDEIIRPAIDKADGRFVKHTGDGFIAEFGSAADAFGCACAIHEALAATDSIARNGPEIAMRIGLDIGDIMVKADGDVFGNGVIAAARLEPLAPRGGICLSHRARDQLRSAKVEFEDIGDQSLKNLTEPIHAFLVHPGGVRAHRMQRLKRAMRRRLRTIIAIGLLIVAGIAALYWFTRAPTAEDFASQWIAGRECSFLRVTRSEPGDTGAQLRLSGAAANPELIEMELIRDADRAGVAIERINMADVFPANSTQCQWLLRIRNYQYPGISRLITSDATMAQDKGWLSVRFRPSDLREHVGIFSIDPNGDIMHVQDRGELIGHAEPAENGMMEAGYTIDHTGWAGFLLMESDRPIPSELVTDSSNNADLIRRFDEAAMRDHWTFELVWIYSGMNNEDGD